MASDDIRPEVVQAIADAVVQMNPAAVTRLIEVVGEVGITPEEQARGDALALSMLDAMGAYKAQRLEAFEVLHDGRTFDHEPSWDELFTGLHPEAVERLGDRQCYRV